MQAYPIQLSYNKIHSKQIMMNIEMYTQMGYSQALVRRAYDYSQKNRIDMFDALQQLQNQDYAEQEQSAQGNIPTYSFLNGIKSFNLGEYEIIYSRTGVKESSGVRDQIREPNTPVGLFNVSNCCYLNSLLQCYFLMGSFTRQILAAQEIPELPEQSQTKNKRIKNEYLLLATLKEMFAKMKLSSHRYLDPTPVLKNLVNSVGEKIQYGDQKDLNQVNLEIVERLSECLMYTKKYFTKEGSASKLKKRENIKNLFYGQKVEHIEGIEGSTVSDFMGIILNPKHDNILFALDEQFNYDVQIDGKIMKRHTFIKSLPKFLFLTISRIEYLKKGNQFLKNSQKIAFDFVIYLDQYLENNQQQSKIKAPKIRELQNLKTIRKSQMNHLNILEQKIQECKAHAKYLIGWEDRFPTQKEVEDEKDSLKKQIEQIQKELEEVESRKQKFVLMYIFVHRGDAISGHYWGYGRNGNHWFRFDVNCVSIKEGDILIDMEKSGGTAYALVYAKEDEIQNFGYPYCLQQKPELVRDSGDEQRDYEYYIPTTLRKRIIKENIEMHRFLQKQRIKTTVENILKEYKTKFNIVKSETEKYRQSQSHKNIPLYCNLACYLQSTQQTQFMKYNIFSVAVHSKAEITCRELIDNQPLLQAIQKAFKKKIKGKMALKHFALECEPMDGAHYKEEVDAYLAGKKCLQFIRLISVSIKDYPKTPDMQCILQDISEVLKRERGVYLQSMVRQLVAIFLLDLAVKGKPIKLEWADACKSRNSLLKDQLQALSYKELPKSVVLKATSISKMEVELDWSIMSLKKGFESELIGAIKQIISRLEDGLNIHKKNTKQKQIVGVSQKSEPIELI